MSNGEELVNALEGVYQELLRARLAVEKHLRGAVWEWDRSKPGIPGAVAGYIDGVLYFCVDDIPPSRKLSGSLEHQVYCAWMDKLIYAFYSADLPERLRYDPALVAICIHSSEPRDWDVDNRSINGIINALRAIHVIPDDSYQHMAYLVIGKPAEKESYTQIFVTHMPDFSQILPLNAPKVSALRPSKTPPPSTVLLENDNLEVDFWGDNS
ncbi:hypothetical protein V3F56_03650 [Moorellaceae bacterium AZ2]